MWKAFVIARELAAMAPEARKLAVRVIRAIKYGQQSEAEKLAAEAAEAQDLFRKGKESYRAKN